MFFDYAGVESPWHAAQELGIPVKHIASCDCASGPQKYIMRNHMPEIFFRNVFTRPVATMKNLGVGRAVQSTLTCQVLLESGSKAHVNVQY
jgi:hypothetical protein